MRIENSVPELRGFEGLTKVIERVIDGLGAIRRPGRGREAEALAFKCI
jgi:hypothetical protein